MNRRTSIKGLIVFVSAGVSSLSIYEWFKFKSVPDDHLFLDKKVLIADLAEVIIPRTDTPGAKDAKVEEFILNMMLFCSDHKTRNNFLRGLNDLEDYSSGKFRNTFSSCNQKEKILVMEHFENESKSSIGILGKIKRKLLGAPFFIILKELTVEGYCTSQIGATQGLAYDYIPSTYQACIPLTQNQKSWATK